MRNIFLLYMPPDNLEAMTHYRDTIQEKVSFDRVARYLSKDMSDRLRHVFGNRPIAVWGSRDGPQNRARYEKMEEGDDLLIVEGPTIRFMGKVALKAVSPDLSRELWKNIDTKEHAGWDLIYFIANPVELGVPIVEFYRLFSYSEHLQLRGFSSVAADRLEAFYSRYDDLYAILLRRKEGQSVFEKPLADAVQPPPPRPSAASPEEMPPDAQPSVSDHVRMQWKLANLGVKAGEKIWVPTADQGRLKSAFDFDNFEREFAAGIDLPRNYYENIDVVWKEEYRIDAAFEVENSTSIYSGLLRFADLNVVAPNTTYPMFIVAPAERRNRVREQLLRPAFRRLELRNKVKFLSYEAVEDIERFFEKSSSGLTVDLVRGKAETVS